MKVKLTALLKKNPRLALLCLLVTINLVGEFFTYRAVRQVRLQTERRIYAEIADETSERALTGSRFLGFSTDQAERILRISARYSIPFQLPASIIAHENGHTGFWAAIWLTPWDIRLTFWDPRDWQVAALCQLLQRKAFRRIMRSDQLGPFLSDVATTYNPGSTAAWAKDVTVLLDQFLASTSLPERKARMSRAPFHSRRKR